MKSDEYNENLVVALAWACLDTGYGQSGLPVQKSIKYTPVWS